MEISSLRKFNNNRVWVYNASTLKLISDSFSSMQKAADYFKVDYRSILNHLDTNLATILFLIKKKGRWKICIFVWGVNLDNYILYLFILLHLTL